MNSIKDWLNGGRDYATGLALFKVYGQDSALLTALEQGPSEYRHKRMVAALLELKDIAQRVTVGEKKHAFSTPEHSKVKVSEADMPEDVLPALGDPYRDKWLPHYIEMNALRHMLLDAASDKERGEMAHQILELERKCMYWWERSEYYQRTGQHMEETTEVSTDVVDKNALYKRLMNLRTYVSRGKAELAKTKNTEAVLVKIAAYKAEIDDIELKLGYG